MAILSEGFLKKNLKNKKHNSLWNRYLEKVTKDAEIVIEDETITINHRPEKYEEKSEEKYPPLLLNSSFFRISLFSREKRRHSNVFEKKSIMRCRFL